MKRGSGGESVGRGTGSPCEGVEFSFAAFARRLSFFSIFIALSLHAVKYKNR